jgi:hypothetical protein
LEGGYRNDSGTEYQECNMRLTVQLCACACAYAYAYACVCVCVCVRLINDSVCLIPGGRPEVKRRPVVRQGEEGTFLFGPLRESHILFVWSTPLSASGPPQGCSRAPKVTRALSKQINNNHPIHHPECKSRILSPSLCWLVEQSVGERGTLSYFH